jgi:exonuclease VII small subunit
LAAGLKAWQTALDLIEQNRQLIEQNRQLIERLDRRNNGQNHANS